MSKEGERQKERKAKRHPGDAGAFCPLQRDKYRGDEEEGRCASRAPLPAPVLYRAKGGGAVRPGGVVLLRASSQVKSLLSVFQTNVS